MSAPRFVGLLAFLALRAVKGFECTDYGGVSTTSIDGFDNVCCATSCSPCGGHGCAEQSGGASSCCANAITEAQNLCSEDKGAPCLLNLPTPSPTASPTSACSAYNGIRYDRPGSYEDICCSDSCKQCGGVGCGEADPNGDGSNNCCVTEIDEAGNMCSDVGTAPCILSIEPSACSLYNGISSGRSGSYEHVCCSESCSMCGGDGCGDAHPNGDGSNNCCVTEIDEAARSCSEVGTAPCVMIPGPAPAPGMATASPSTAAPVMVTPAPVAPPTVAPATATPVPVAPPTVAPATATPVPVAPPTVAPAMATTPTIAPATDPPSPTASPTSLPSTVLAFDDGKAAPISGCCADFGGIPSELAGYEHVCCPSSCYPCGGVGCLPGCCVTGIEETGTVCGGDDEGVAPCLLTSG